MKFIKPFEQYILENKKDKSTGELKPVDNPIVDEVEAATKKGEGSLKTGKKEDENGLIDIENPIADIVSDKVNKGEGLLD